MAADGTGVVVTAEAMVPQWMHDQITAEQYDSWSEDQCAGIEIVGRHDCRESERIHPAQSDREIASERTGRGRRSRVER